MTKEKKKFQLLTSKNICEIYNLLHSEGIISFPLSNDAVHKIESLVANINGSNFGVPNYVSVEQKIVAYLYFLIKNHPFTDGNKRTAVLSFLVLCERNNYLEKLISINLDELAVFLEEQKTDHHMVIELVSRAIFSN